MSVVCLYTLVLKYEFIIQSINYICFIDTRHTVIALPSQCNPVNFCPQACLTVLSDNKRCARTPYLVSVMTGWRYGGGTQATTYMYLSGVAGRSVRRELSDATRPLFQSGGEDWFLLATRKDLGDLQSLHVWHVGSRASRPDW